MLKITTPFLGVMFKRITCQISVQALKNLQGFFHLFSIILGGMNSYMPGTVLGSRALEKASRHTPYSQRTYGSQ